MSNSELINLLFEELTTKEIIQPISNISSVFFDEPKLYFYSTKFNQAQKYFKASRFKVNTDNLAANGISSTSKYLALIRCLGESVERFCQCCYDNKLIIFSSYDNLIKKHNKNVFDPKIYKKIPNINDKKMGWIKGYDLLKNKEIFIPAQLIYLNYQRANEPHLNPNISTGAAGGFSHESTILNGIYEIIERDAFMTIYLNRIRAKKIDLTGVNDKAIRTITKYFQKYGLDVSVYDITNDLHIPAFLTILIDNLKNTPKITLGIKSSLNVKKAILGSIEEAFQIRLYIRNELLKRKSTVYEINGKKIKSIFDRVLFWLSSSNIQKLDFITKQTPQVVKFVSFKFNQIEELDEVKKRIQNKGLQVYYVDITLANFKKLNYSVYKAIIPGLQPLYLDESEKEWKIDRLKTVAHYFGKKKLVINTVPHPFL